MLNDPTFLAKLTEWQNKVQEINAHAHLITEERALRQEVFALAFPAPREGANNAELPAGWGLKGTLKIDRKIDEAQLPIIMEAIRNTFNFNPDQIIHHEPKLNVKIYKSLPEEVRKSFDVALTIKPAMPTIELVPPKPAK